MAKPDLVFLTQDNGEKLKRIAKGDLGANCKSCGHFVAGPHDCDGIIDAEVEPDPNAA